MMRVIKVKVSLKIYSLEMGFSRLAMLVDYLETKLDSRVIHVFIAAPGTLNSKYLNVNNSLIIEKDVYLNARLQQTLQSLNKKFHYTLVTVFSQQNMLLPIMQQILQSLPGSVAKSLHLNIYDGNHSDVEKRQQLFAYPEISLASLMNIEEQQLSNWLKKPEIPLVNGGKQISHLLWQRFYSTTYFWLDITMLQSTSSLASELSQDIYKLPLPANKHLSQIDKLTLCKLLNIPAKVLSNLINPGLPLLWIMDSNEMPWFKPIPALNIYRESIQHEGNIIYQTFASNLNDMPSAAQVQMLPWWVSPEIATFFPQDEMKSAGDVEIWNQLKVEATSHDAAILREDYWVFNMEASMGDLLFLLSTLPTFRAKYAGEIVINLPKIYHSLALRSPYVDAVWDIDHPIKHYEELQRAIKKNKYINIIDWQTVLAPEHMQSAICTKLSISYRETEQQLILQKTVDDQKRVEQFIQQHQLLNVKTVLLHPAIGAPNRSWPQQHWSALCNNFLDNGWRVVFIGSNHNKYKQKGMPVWDDPRIVDAIDVFSPIESTILMDHCDLLVSCDAGPVALAANSNIAICALYSNIPGQYRLPIRQGKMGWNASAINRGCQFGQCGETFINEAFRIPTRPETQQYFSGEAFAKWCPNENKYACLNEYSPAHFWQAIQDFLDSDHYIPFADRLPF
ncbi:glycosyltransferase family 9 protein [Pantoea sp. DY-5]|uniref:glycosyltransferase family 9 protein n=1 Tax=Pantoea sp. DY-5 TaxID=2871488 RepID=UPI001C9442B0|nr:glycosyltransferase family 9 protein [Pantoea sp. DY-5]MBY4838755.1 hypothetical protein [Pantoea sp. DY-5]